MWAGASNEQQPGASSGPPARSHITLTCSHTHRQGLQVHVYTGTHGLVQADINSYMILSSVHTGMHTCRHIIHAHRRLYTCPLSQAPTFILSCAHTQTHLSHGEQKFWARVACVCGPHLDVTLCHASGTGLPTSSFSPPLPLCSLPGSHLTLKEPLLIPHATISIMFMALHVLITVQKRNQRKSLMSRP